VGKIDQGEPWTDRHHVVSMIAEMRSQGQARTFFGRGGIELVVGKILPNRDTKVPIFTRGNGPLGRIFRKRTNLMG